MAIGDRYFCYLGLPMGWLNSPAAFTKFLKPVTNWICTQGGLFSRSNLGTEGWCQVLAYLDDFLVINRSFGEALSHDVFIRDWLGKLGLRWHPKKSHWTPSQELEHLGLLIDTHRNRLAVPISKLRKIRTWAKDLVIRARQHQRWLPKRELARFAGTVQACTMALPLTGFYLRALYMDMHSPHCHSKSRSLSNLVVFGSTLANYRGFILKLC
ncbi:hypothetical protein BSKO_02598 [Bryopsis sp. KO-2023]|nr:hypothetical protein BSKO_02598 [Bryopsis sp. KO-2023]